MKVPEKIKKAIRECAKYNEKARINEDIVQKWLEKNCLTEEILVEKYGRGYDTTKNMEDGFIDYCQTTNNPENFIEELENL